VKYPDYTGDEACAEIGVEFFYLDEHSGTPKNMLKMFKEMCIQCPIYDDCLEWAVRHERHGLWAGTTPRTRSNMRYNRGIMIETPDYWVFQDRSAS